MVLGEVEEVKEFQEARVEATVVIAEGVEGTVDSRRRIQRSRQKMNIY